MQQTPVQIELAREVRFQHRLARRGQHRHGDQIDGSHGCSGVDFGGDARGEIGDRLADPARRRLLLFARRARRAAPMRIVLLQQLVERRWAAPRLTCTLPNFLRNTDNDLIRPDTLSFCFGATGQLADVGPALDDALVAEVHRHEHHSAFRVAQVAAHGHRQHAGARRQQAAGAAAAALDEVFERMAARHHEAEILGEHGGIERIPLEAAPQEERPALAQEMPDHRQIEVRRRRRCAEPRNPCDKSRTTAAGNPCGCGGREHR